MSQQNLISFEALAGKGITASKVTLWRWERAGRFPKRVVLSHQKIAWLESEVDAHIAGCIAARRQPVAA
jgi:prophage regulatory protein